MMATQDNTSLYDLISEFDLQNRHYFIFSLRDVRELKPDKTLSVVDCFFSYDVELQEVTRFQVGDRICLIAESIATPQESNLPEQLTERERQIATLVALGQANKQIASELGISKWTVDTYLRRIFTKLGVESRAAMVYRCGTLIQKLRDREADLGG